MAGNLSRHLIPVLLARFSDRGICLHHGKQPVASFPAAHPEVGDLQIYDDEEELTVSVGQLTHGHFAPRNDQQPLEKREEEVVGRVIEFLDAVFDDRIAFWSSGKAGGWYPRAEVPVVRRPSARTYTWSGPLAKP
jgi:hypothetical protein